MATVAPSTAPIEPGRKSPSRQRWILVAASVTVILGCIMLYELKVPGQEFDQNLWEQSAELNRGSRYPRLEMADRLVAEGTLRSKNRDEVVRMLGEPPKTDYFRDWDVVYWLGPERRFMGIDSEWLVIRFDSQGQVAKYEIVRD